MKRRIDILLWAAAVIAMPTMFSCHSGEKEHDDDEHIEHADKDDDDHDHEHEGAITLSAHQAEEFGVKVEKLVPGNFSEIIKVSGRIEPTASGRVTVTARRSGIVTLAGGISVGASVRSGAPVATISSKGIQGGDANAAAIAACDAAYRELERLRPLHKDGLVTTSTLNEAERAYKEASAAVGGGAGAGTECASAAGVISALFVSSGDFVETGAPIATIARDTRLTLRADVPERFASMIPGIKTANFRPDCAQTTLSLSSLDGKAVSPGNINPAENGYIPVFFTFNSSAATQPGSFAEIYLVGSDRGNVLSVPRSALIEMQGNCYAYVRMAGHGDAYEKRLVRTGASDGINVEILDGLKEGEDVVVDGASIVRMAETSAIAPPGHSHEH